MKIHKDIMTKMEIRLIHETSSKRKGSSIIDNILSLNKNHRLQIQKLLCIFEHFFQVFKWYIINGAEEQISNTINIRIENWLNSKNNGKTLILK